MYQGGWGECVCVKRALCLCSHVQTRALAHAPVVARTPHLIAVAGSAGRLPAALGSGYGRYASPQSNPQSPSLPVALALELSASAASAVWPVASAA